MDIELVIDEEIEKEKIIIYAKNNNSQITEIINKITNNNDNTIIGYIESEAFILNVKDIWSFYTEDNKVYAKMSNKIYKIKYRVYEIEEMVKNFSFIRISNSEIVNIKKIESLNLGITGTVIFKFKDGSITYASRRSISKIKEYLNL